MGKRVFRMRKNKKKHTSIEAELEARARAQNDTRGDQTSSSENSSKDDTNTSKPNAGNKNESEDDFYVVPVKNNVPKDNKEKKSKQLPLPDIPITKIKKKQQKQAPRNDTRVPVIYRVPDVCPVVPKSPETKKKNKRNNNSKTKDVPNSIDCQSRENSQPSKDNSKSVQTINGLKCEDKYTVSAINLEHTVADMEQIIQNLSQNVEKDVVTKPHSDKHDIKVCENPSAASNTVDKTSNTQNGTKKVNSVPEKCVHSTKNETTESKKPDKCKILRDEVMVRAKKGNVARTKNRLSINKTIERIKQNLKKKEKDDVEKLPVPNACQLSDLVPDEQHKIHKVINSKSEDVDSRDKSKNNGTETNKKTKDISVQTETVPESKKSIKKKKVIKNCAANKKVAQKQCGSKDDGLVSNSDSLQSRGQVNLPSEEAATTSEVIYDEPVCNKMQKTRDKLNELKQLLTEVQSELGKSPSSDNEVIYDEPVIVKHNKTKKFSGKRARKRNGKKNKIVASVQAEIESSDGSVAENNDSRIFKDLSDEITPSDVLDLAIKLRNTDGFSKFNEEGGFPMSDMIGFDEFFKQEIVEAFKKTGGDAKTALESINMHDLLFKFGKFKLEDNKSPSPSEVLVAEKGDVEKAKKSGEKCDENKNIINGVEAEHENSSSDLSEKVNYNDSDNESITSVSQQGDGYDDEDDLYDEICDDDKLNEQLENLEIDDKETNVESEQRAQIEYDEMGVEYELGVSQNKKRKTDEHACQLTDKDIDLDEIVLDELCQNLEQILQDDSSIVNDKSDMNDGNDGVSDSDEKITNEIISSEQFEDDTEDIELENAVEENINDDYTNHAEFVENLQDDNQSTEKTFMTIAEANEYGYISYLTQYRLRFPGIIFVNHRLPKMGSGLTPMFYDNDVISENLILQDETLRNMFDKFPVFAFNEYPVSYIVTLGRYLVRKLPIDVNEVVVVSFAECLVMKELRRPTSSEYAVAEFIQAIHGLMSAEGQQYGMPGAEAYDQYVKMLTNNQLVNYKSPFDPRYYNDLEALFLYALFIARTKAYCQFSILDMHILCKMLCSREGYVPDTVMLAIVENLDRIGYTVQITNVQIGLYYKRYGHSTTLRSLITRMKFVFDDYYRDFKDVSAVLKEIPNSYLTCFVTIGKAIKFFADFPWASIMLLCKKEWHNYTLAVISLNGINNIKPQCVYTSNYNNYPHLAYTARQVLIRVAKEPTLEYYGGWEDLTLKYKAEIDELLDNYIIYKNTLAQELLRVEQLSPREAREYDMLTNLLHGYVYVRTLLPMDFECEHAVFKSKSLEQEREWLQLMRTKTKLKLRYFSCPHSTSYNYEELYGEMEANYCDDAE